MTQFSWKDFLVTVIPVVLNFLVGALITYSTIVRYNSTRHAPFTPPGWVFSLVWTVMYGLIAAGGYLGYNGQPSTTEKNNFLIAFYLQVLFNFAWVLCFFGALQARVALVVLIALVGTVIYLIYKSWAVNKTAASFFIVYLAWLLFATFLNVGYVVVNRM
jgi:benzodiazapine receptor